MLGGPSITSQIFLIIIIIISLLLIIIISNTTPDSWFPSLLHFNNCIGVFNCFCNLLNYILQHCVINCNSGPERGQKPWVLGCLGLGIGAWCSTRPKAACCMGLGKGVVSSRGSAMEEEGEKLCMLLQPATCPFKRALALHLRDEWMEWLCSPACPPIPMNCGVMQVAGGSRCLPDPTICATPASSSHPSHKYKWSRLH